MPARPWRECGYDEHRCAARPCPPGDCGSEKLLRRDPSLRGGDPPAVRAPSPPGFGIAGRGLTVVPVTIGDEPRAPGQLGFVRKRLAECRYQAKARASPAEPAGRSGRPGFQGDGCPGMAAFQGRVPASTPARLETSNREPDYSKRPSCSARSISFSAAEMASPRVRANPVLIWCASTKTVQRHAGLSPSISTT